MIRIPSWAFPRHTHVLLSHSNLDLYGRASRWLTKKGGVGVISIFQNMLFVCVMKQIFLVVL